MADPVDRHGDADRHAYLSTVGNMMLSPYGSDVSRSAAWHGHPPLESAPPSDHYDSEYNNAAMANVGSVGDGGTSGSGQRNLRVFAHGTSDFRRGSVHDHSDHASSTAFAGVESRAADIESRAADLENDMYKQTTPGGSAGTGYYLYAGGGGGIMPLQSRSPITYPDFADDMHTLASKGPGDGSAGVAMPRSYRSQSVGAVPPPRRSVAQRNAVPGASGSGSGIIQPSADKVREVRAVARTGVPLFMQLNAAKLSVMGADGTLKDAVFNSRSGTISPRASEAAASAAALEAGMRTDTDSQGRATLAYSKKPRLVSFKPYTVSDYHDRKARDSEMLQSTPLDRSGPSVATAAASFSTSLRSSIAAGPRGAAAQLRARTGDASHGRRRSVSPRASVAGSSGRVVTAGPMAPGGARMPLVAVPLTDSSRSVGGGGSYEPYGYTAPASGEAYGYTAAVAESRVRARAATTGTPGSTYASEYEYRVREGSMFAVPSPYDLPTSDDYSAPRHIPSPAFRQHPGGYPAPAAYSGASFGEPGAFSGSGYTGNASGYPGGGSSAVSMAELGHGGAARYPGPYPPPRQPSPQAYPVAQHFTYGAPQRSPAQGYGSPHESFTSSDAAPAARERGGGGIGSGGYTAHPPAGDRQPPGGRFNPADARLAPGNEWHGETTGGAGTGVRAGSPSGSTTGYAFTSVTGDVKARSPMRASQPSPMRASGLSGIRTGFRSNATQASGNGFDSSTNSPGFGSGPLSPHAAAAGALEGMPVVSAGRRAGRLRHSTDGGEEAGKTS